MSSHKEIWLVAENDLICEGSVIAVFRDYDAHRTLPSVPTSDFVEARERLFLRDHARAVLAAQAPAMAQKLLDLQTVDPEINLILRKAGVIP